MEYTYIYVLVLLTVFFDITCGFEYKDYNEEWNKKSESVELDSGYADDGKSPVYDLKQAPDLFRRFVEDYGKTYKTEEDYKKHYKNFVNNLEDINRLNKEGSTATFDINMFADLGEDELESITG